MIDPEVRRIETKLKLWETPGFFQFVEDLKNYMPESAVGDSIKALKRTYEARLDEFLPPSKFTQTKLQL